VRFGHSGSISMTPCTRHIADTSDRFGWPPEALRQRRSPVLGSPPIEGGLVTADQSLHDEMQPLLRRA
jgi:hypothetical protein